MPTNSSQSAHGTLLKVSDGGSPASYTTISHVKSIAGPGMKAVMIDVTNMESTNHWREFIAGLLEGGQVTCGCSFVNDTIQGTASGLLYLFKNRTKRVYQIVIPLTVPVTLQFEALVAEFPFNFDMEAEIQFTLTLQVSGEVSIS